MDVVDSLVSNIAAPGQVVEGQYSPDEASYDIILQLYTKCSELNALVCKTATTGIGFCNGYEENIKQGLNTTTAALKGATEGAINGAQQAVVAQIFSAGAKPQPPQLPFGQPQQFQQPQIGFGQPQHPQIGFGQPQQNQNGFGMSQFQLSQVPAKPRMSHLEWKKISSTKNCRGCSENKQHTTPCADTCTGRDCNFCPFKHNG